MAERSKSGGTGSTVSDTSATGGATGAITVYTALEDDQIAKYLPLFQKEYPDIKVNKVRDSTGVVIAKLLAEKDNPQADAVWGLAVSSLLVADQQEMLEPYAPKGLEYGVEFKFNTVVTDISHPNFVAGGEAWTCDRLYVCSGTDFETLYPAIYQQSGITKVKLQMLRTVPQPNDWRLGPALCAGLTLTHYTTFAHCQSLASLRTRIQTETPYFVKWGIHVMVSQNALGELTIGDSHEYGLNPDPFDRADLNQYILDYFKSFA